MRAPGTVPAATHPDGRRALTGIDRLRGAWLVSGAAGVARRDRPNVAEGGSISAATPRAAKLGGAAPVRDPGPGARGRLGHIGPIGARRGPCRQAQLSRYDSDWGPKPGLQKQLLQPRAHAPDPVTVPPPRRDFLLCRDVRVGRGSTPIADQGPRRPERPGQDPGPRLGRLQLVGRGENLAARPSCPIRPFPPAPTVGLRRTAPGARESGRRADEEPNRRASELAGRKRRVFVGALLRCRTPHPS